MMSKCKGCGKDFEPWTKRQEFCTNECKGAYHRRRYRDLAKKGHRGKPWNPLTAPDASSSSR